MAFYVLTFAVSWALWAPLLAWLRSEGRLGAVAGDEPLTGMPWWVAAGWFLGASAPSIVGLALTARSGGRGAVADLLMRLVDVDVGVGWNVVAWLGPMAVGLLAVLVARRAAGTRVAPRRFALIPVALVMALPFGPLGEELGWRGYALPRLLTDHGALSSALLIGVVWTLWHLPLFWAPLGTTISGSPVTLPRAGRYLVEVTAISVVMTWLFVNTGGSLWIAVGFHAAWNAGMHRFVFAPLSNEATALVDRWMTTGLVLAAAILAWWPGLSWRGG